jgi:hypothetical protein
MTNRVLKVVPTLLKRPEKVDIIKNMSVVDFLNNCAF